MAELVTDGSAYGRVTNPERYAPLHRSAANVIAELRREFDMTVTEVEPEQGDVGPPVISAWRLTPGNGGARVTVTLTRFPGLYVRFGEWHEEALPSCGCDACDESPEELAEDLREKLWAVAQGEFRETEHSYCFTFPHGGRWGSSKPPRWRRVRAREYPSWPRRG